MSRHHNVFYYYRGPSSVKTAQSTDGDRQLEDNTTKALVNVLEHGGPEVTRSFLAEFAPAVLAEGDTELVHNYFLQGGPEGTLPPSRFLLGLSVQGVIAPATVKEVDGRDGGSRIDGAVEVEGAGLLAIETKVVGMLDFAQLQRHAMRWEISPASPAKAAVGDLPPEWALASWAEVYRWARGCSREVDLQPARFLLEQLCEYLDLSGLAPFGGLREDDFAFFLLPAAERDPQRQAEVKARLEGLWEMVSEVLTEREVERIGPVRVANIKATDQNVAAFGDAGPGRANLTIEFGCDDLQLNVVGWNVTQATRLERWLGNASLEALNDYRLVLWRRTAHRDHKGAPYWQLSTQTEIERIDLSAADGADVADRIAACHARLDSTWDKLAFHLRRSWDRDEVVQKGEAIIPGLATEVSRLVPIVDEINAS